MSRSETLVFVKYAAQMPAVEEGPAPVILPISRAERTFRWINHLRSEPRFELETEGSSEGPNPPDRAA